jgi:hypothetical protein
MTENLQDPPRGTSSSWIKIIGWPVGWRLALTPVAPGYPPRLRKLLMTTESAPFSRAITWTISTRHLNENEIGDGTYIYIEDIRDVPYKTNTNYQPQRTGGTRSIASHPAGWT